MPVVFSYLVAYFSLWLKKICLRLFSQAVGVFLFLADRLSKLMKRGIFFFFLSKAQTWAYAFHEWLLSKYANEHFSELHSTHGHRGNIQWSPCAIVIKYLWISAWKILVYPKLSSFLIFVRNMYKQNIFHCL